MAQSKTTKQRTFRRLEDLNVIDNFLFQEMLSQKEDGEEFARILLKTILGKPIRNVKIIPQKTSLVLTLIVTAFALTPIFRTSPIIQTEK